MTSRGTARTNKGAAAKGGSRSRKVSPKADDTRDFSELKQPLDLIIAGGGPAGMMAGLLFARAGCNVVVLEKHADFFRDFRGDTVHPSTMEILSQLGMLARFLKRPHNRVSTAQ
ncbi:MAG: FAD-binding protein, partial [Bradyrhizobium sp.]|nr:FAD-binding protein [Bradyrhizobium sp.]